MAETNTGSPDSPGAGLDLKLSTEHSSEADVEVETKPSAVESLTALLEVTEAAPDVAAVLAYAKQLDTILGDTLSDNSAKAKTAAENMLDSGRRMVEDIANASKVVGEFSDNLADALEGAGNSLTGSEDEAEIDEITYQAAQELVTGLTGAQYKIKSAQKNGVAQGLVKLQGPGLRLLMNDLDLGKSLESQQKEVIRAARRALQDQVIGGLTQMEQGLAEVAKLRGDEDPASRS